MTNHTTIPTEPEEMSVTPGWPETDRSDVSKEPTVPEAPDNQPPDPKELPAKREVQLVFRNESVSDLVVLQHNNGKLAINRKES